MGKGGRDVEVIKVELPRDLAERFRKYVAEKYGLRRGSLSRAIADLIIKELALYEGGGGGIDSIVGLGLQSDYQWGGEDLVDALRRRAHVPG
ncbi:hypothetical protein [Vulcanisaeta distributa]|uniref:Uncharacterized protein n=1 Tax=Vulcanisaeta distributa (strain DSM 14429 / JCM 11212 / NBRC 100878 / IC-017) TaxID=572478 RepID=E1QQA7_VULDI|nr:hypothetical protein [Vulcanisaeta distributa]ADN51594.1 conserved hypothetical protein [Vulcanisaeta distributa DSM 14429]